MGEWLHEQKSRWVRGQLNGWMNSGGYKDGQKEGQMTDDGWISWSIYGCVGGWLDGMVSRQAGRWIDR